MLPTCESLLFSAGEKAVSILCPLMLNLHTSDLFVLINKSSAYADDSTIIADGRSALVVQSNKSLTYADHSTLAGGRYALIASLSPNRDLMLTIHK